MNEIGVEITTGRDEDLENRFNYHPPKTEETKLQHEEIRGACKVLAYFIKETVPPGREQSLAITHLEEVMMWANAGIARNQNPKHHQFIASVADKGLCVCGEPWEVPVHK